MESEEREHLRHSTREFSRPATSTDRIRPELIDRQRYAHEARVSRDKLTPDSREGPGRKTTEAARAAARDLQVSRDPRVRRAHAYQERQVVARRAASECTRVRRRRRVAERARARAGSRRPARFMAATAPSPSATGMAESSAAWKTQIARSFRRCAALAESPGSAPQTGTTALRNSGYSSAKRQAPTPPADWPASEMRSGSTAYDDATRVASARAALEPRPRPARPHGRVPALRHDDHKAQLVGERRIRVVAPVEVKLPALPRIERRRLVPQQTLAASPRQRLAVHRRDRTH